jgi:glycerophosphoryl diester phosphodiesterase
MHKIVLFFLLICVYTRSLAQQSLPPTLTPSLPPQHGLLLGKTTLRDFLRYDSLRLPIVSAHRGGRYMAGYPENAIETFAYTLSKTFAMIECDVSMTRDSVLFLMHDNTLERTTTGRGEVAKTNWAEIAPLRLIDDYGDTTHFHPPLFESVLKWADAKALLTVDVKRGVPFDRVVAFIEKHHMENHAVVITYNAQDARRVYDLNNSLMISVSARNLEEWERIEQTGIPTANLIAFTGTREPAPELYKLLHDKGILCILGTMGNLDNMAKARGEDTYGRLIANGADVLATDRPIEAARAIATMIPAKSWRRERVRE